MWSRSEARQEFEIGADEGPAVQAAFNGMRAAVLHPPELGESLVELVVAHAVEVQPHQVHRLDGRFVVEEGGDEG